MILAYRIFTNILYPFLFILLYVRVILKGRSKRYKEKYLLKKEKINNPKSSLIWFHAASIGEFKSIIPIIKEVNAKKQTMNS